MAGSENRIWRDIIETKRANSVIPISKLDLENNNNQLLSTIDNKLLNTNNQISLAKDEINALNTNYITSQDLLFSDSNVLFEEAFRSITKMQLCASIVVRVKQLIENNQHDYLFNAFYNYAKIIRPELDILFAAEPDLATSVFINSTYPGEYTFSFNNLSYNKYTNYELNSFDNLDISRVPNFDKTIVGLLNTKCNLELQNYLANNSTATQFYSLMSLPKSEINQIPQIAYLYFKLDQTKNIWTVCASVTDLLYNSIINDDNNDYNTFTSAINNLLNNWDPIAALDDNITTIIEYKSALSFNTTKCLYSDNYPEWTGDYLPNLHKGNVDDDVVSEYKNTINQLWYNYPKLQENDIVILYGFFGEAYYANVIKIIKYNGTLAFKQQKLDLRPFFPAIEIKNDIIINGSLKVKNSEGVDIVQTDNIKNVIAFQDKIGVNQEIYNVKGLVDIDNLSNKSIDIILNEFSQPLLNSYAITEQLKGSISFNGIINDNLANSLYNQYNFAIFHTYILQSIEDGDIKFDHVEGDTSEIFKDFSTRNISNSSFAKIKKIVSELYTMIHLEKLTVSEDFIFSFIEILSDRTGTFLCSMRAITRYNQDDASYKIFFITTYLPIEKYYNNKSYVKELNLLADNFSQAHRFINYSKLILEMPIVKQNLIDGKTNDGTVNTYTGFIDNSKYFRNRFNNSSLYLFIRNFPDDIELSVLHEKYPYWQNKPGIKNYLPNTDIPIGEVSKLYHDNYINKFGLFKKGYLFPTTYYFTTGIKFTFLDTIELNGKNYMLGSGVNLADIVSESIIAKGDNKITGNLAIADEKTGNNIFNIDTVDKQSYLLYNVGIGTHNPTTKLDVKDCGLADVIEIINKVAKKFNEINFNVDRLKQYIATNGTTNIKNFIETQFYDPLIDVRINPNNKITQTKENYYFLTEGIYDINSNFIIDNIIDHYHFIYDNWNGKTLKQIVENEIQNKESAKLMMDEVKFVNNNNIFFNGSYRITYYKWINGVKISIGYVFTIGTKLYVIKTGVDIQNNLTIETNKNIVKFLETLATHGNRIQNLVKVKTNPSLVINENVSKINRDKRILNNPNGRLFKYIIDMKSKDNTSIQELDINTYEPLTPVKTFDSLNTSEEDFQLRNKMSTLGIKLTDFYSAYWGAGSSYYLKPFFRGGQYGILHCEDDYYDYCATVWLENIDTTSKPGSNLLTFYSFELKLVDVLNPSLKVHGDTKLEGDLYIYDQKSDENYIFVDANNHFLGINTTQVYGNYSNVYDTTSGIPLAKHSVYIHSDTYPNTAIERNAEKPILLETPEFKADELTPYYYFKNFSTSTARRQSDYFTFQEMVEYGKQCRNSENTGIPNAFGFNKPNVYCYGPDRNYEVKDKTGLVKEIGCLAMGIEKLDSVTDVSNVLNATDARAAFSVNVVDRVPGTMNALERNIMYCSNDSNLYVNNVTTNGVQFGGHPDNTPDLTKLLHLDANGNLMFGNKYVILSDTAPIN
jgi:hypothetical protein